MNRLHQIILIFSVLVASWMGMQAVHEFGHVLGAWASGGSVAKVVWHPLTISRTDFADNPHPLLVVWAGPVLGVLLPVAFWLIGKTARMPGIYVLRFFAGFCLIANGAYIAFGSFDAIGDCGQMLRHGSPPWSLWVFGLVTMPAGLWLWHRQGEHFGLGKAKGTVNPSVAFGTFGICLLLLALSLAFGGE
jgi:hypothetical protein